jgi:transcriptional regulator with XRE-family HTH domain
MLAQPKLTRLEWQDVGLHLRSRRVGLRLSQKALARVIGVKQSFLSQLEAGKRTPTLDQLAALAERLDVPLQWFINGKTQPDFDNTGIALELRALGIEDLLFKQVVVPGAFREPEQILALALRGDAPDARVLETIPYILNNRVWDRWLLFAYALKYDRRVLHRLGWLIDIALILRGQIPHQVDPRTDTDLEWIKRQAWKRRPPRPVDLGFSPPPIDQLPTVHRRWRIHYPTNLQGFLDRINKLLVK